MKIVKERLAQPRPSRSLAAPRSDYKAAIARLLVPLLVLLAASLLIRWWDLDLTVARSVWSGEWRLKHFGGVEFLYDFGSLPALVAGGLGLAAWVASFKIALLRPARGFGLYLALCLILGPGLVVNSVFKEHFGRPRPRDVVEFGGKKEYRAVGEKPFEGDGKSFPSGHTAMGFFWIAPCIYFWRRHRTLALLFALVGTLQGAAMGFGRIVQGGHWLSDVLWSAGLVYLTSFVIWLVVSESSHPLVNARPSDKFPVFRRP